MPHIAGLDRFQLLLLPESLDDYVGPEDAVRFIEGFVDGLDLAASGFMRVEPKETGRPGYMPADLLKLYIYGYLNRVRSSRRLEAETHRNIEVIWLLRHLKPDFKTIADFRRDNRKAFRPVFRQFVLLCRQMNLFGRELLAVDGTRIKAVNNKDRNFTRASLAEFIKAADAKLEDYLQRLDQSDATESATGGSRVNNLAEKITAIRERRERYKDMLAELDQTGESQISLTDPDSRAMAAHTHVAVGYNVQIAVDAKHKLIVEQQVTNQVVDMGLLAQTGEPAKEVLGVERIAVVADRGYFKIEDIEACEKAGIDPYVPRPQRGPAVRAGRFRKDEFRYDPTSDSSVPSRSASPSLFVFSAARLEKDQLPQQPSLPGLPDPVAVHGQSFPLRVASRDRGCIGPNASPHSAAPRHPRQTPRDRRTPVWLDQTMDEPRRVSDARAGEGGRGAQPDRARLQPPAHPQYRGAVKADRRAPSLKATPEPPSLGRAQSNLEHQAR